MSEHAYRLRLSMVNPAIVVVVCDCDSIIRRLRLRLIIIGGDVPTEPRIEVWRRVALPVTTSHQRGPREVQERSEGKRANTDLRELL